MANRVLCRACSGRGWIVAGVPGKDWPEACPTCLGYGTAPTLYRLAKHLDERPGALYRLHRMAVGPELAERLLDKLTRFIAERPALT